ncbi:MAG TPA: hypothetical protein VFA02_09425 [Pseudacidobacterium sp.]|nr:hypothetical protein [Pseudacidobacterium sp.]
MKYCKPHLWLVVVLFGGMLATFAAPTLHAQRVSDRDVEAMMRNLHEDAKTFRAGFDEELKKSTIRKTSQEKDARKLAEDFEKQTGEMLGEFRKTKKGDVAVENTMNSAEELGRIVERIQVSPRVASQWEKVRAELAQVSSAFGIHTSM